MMRIRRRFLPMEIVTVLHGLAILSLVYAPAPWITLSGGYSEGALIFSTVAGVALGTMAFACAVLGWISLRAYLTSAVLVGLGTLAYGLFGMTPGSAPRNIFFAYSIVLIGSSLTARVPIRARAVTEEERAPAEVVPFPRAEAERKAEEEERRKAA